MKVKINTPLAFICCFGFRSIKKKKKDSRVCLFIIFLQKCEFFYKNYSSQF